MTFVVTGPISHYHAKYAEFFIVLKAKLEFVVDGINSTISGVFLSRSAFELPVFFVSKANAL